MCRMLLEGFGVGFVFKSEGAEAGGEGAEFGHEVEFPVVAEGRVGRGDGDAVVEDVFGFGGEEALGGPEVADELFDEHGGEGAGGLPVGTDFGLEGEELGLGFAGEGEAAGGVDAVAEARGLGAMESFFGFWAAGLGAVAAGGLGAEVG